MKLKKKFSISVLVAVVLLVCILSTSNSQEQSKPIILKYAAQASQQDCGSVSLDWFLNELEKKSNGQVKFEKYWANSLVPGTKVLQAVANGIADIGQIITVHYTSVLPLHGICQVPGTDQYSTWARAQAWMELYEKEPSVKAELDKYNAMPLNVRGSTGMNLITKKPVRTIADLKGKKIKVTGYAENTVAELGAVPVTLKWEETYTGFERGTVDGTFQDITAMSSLKLFDVGKYYTKFHQADAMLITIINKDVYNKLPKSVKELLNKGLNAENSTTGIMRAFFECPTAKDTLDFKAGLLPKNKVEIISLSATDENHLSQAGGKVRDKWIKEQLAAGVDAKKAVETYAALCQKWNPKTPADMRGK